MAFKLQIMTSKLTKLLLLQLKKLKTPTFYNTQSNKINIHRVSVQIFYFSSAIKVLQKLQHNSLQQTFIYFFAEAFSNKNKTIFLQPFEQSYPIPSLKFLTVYFSPYFFVILKNFCYFDFFFLLFLINLRAWNM